MPRTKLDALRYSKAEMDKSLIKQYMAKRHIYEDQTLADKMKTDASCISKGFKNGFSDKMKMRIHKVLRFEETDLMMLLEASK